MNEFGDAEIDDLKIKNLIVNGHADIFLDRYAYTPSII